MKPFVQFTALLLALLCARQALSAKNDFVQKADLDAARPWIEKHFSTPAELPFTFNIDGESSKVVLARAKLERTDKDLDQDRKEHSLVFTDEKSKIEIRCVAIEYLDYPAVEWTVYFRNVGQGDSPVISDIRAVAMQLTAPAEKDFCLHNERGSRATPSDFQPHETVLGMAAKLRLQSLGGRSTNGSMPYFNLHWPEQGLIVVLGWPGQWSMDFNRDGGSGLELFGGQERTHFKLHPSETARTPLVALNWYQGDWLRGQNIWRRWMVDHNLPRVDGKLPTSQLVACSSHQFGEMIHANEDNQKLFIDRYVAEKFPLKYWWMDAGWYVNDGNWTTTGTWEVDKKRFPNGLRAVTDHAHEKGVKSIVWFEPERVAKGTWLYEQHPDWLLTAPANPGDQLYDPNWRLLNLGHPEARKWLIDHVNGLIKSEGIDLYRQDFNVDPLYFWQNNEPEDRQGITENLYVQGYLAYWDGLRAAKPDLRIDTCASGGRRLDLETLRRSVPLVRSDCLFEPISQQAHTYGLSMWAPYHGTGTLVGHSAIGQNTPEGVSEYDFRSHMASSVTACWDMRDEKLDYNELRRLTSELSRVAPFYVTDYYPLTEHSLDDNCWIGWQFNRPETGEAVVQAFRRDKAPESSQTWKLQGLVRDAEYRVEPLGHGEPSVASGASLMENGLKIELPQARSAAVLMLSKQPKEAGG
jgi:alpha-galactosidase